jgi:hypothetical protein
MKPVAAFFALPRLNQNRLAESTQKLFLDSVLLGADYVLRIHGKTDPIRVSSCGGHGLVSEVFGSLCHLYISL